MSLTIQIDSREQKYEHITKAFDRKQIKWFRSKLPVGDYMELDNARLVIDRKRRLEELCGNIFQDHARFKREIELAAELGITLIILVEHGPLIKSIADVMMWKNPNIERGSTVTGEKIARAMTTIQGKYGVEFRFCDKSQTANRILEIFNEFRPGAYSGTYQINIGKRE